mgnify:CR=1 FL=1
MVDQKYTVREAVKAMNVGVSTIGQGVVQLIQERQGKPYAAANRTVERKFKKPTALLMSDSLNS